MKALFITRPGRTELREIERPAPGPGEVLLRIGTVGFCGSDLKTFRGDNPLVSYPRVPGHEIGATIAQCGAEVPASWRPGMKVTISPYSSCGECPSCRRGRPNACRANQTLGVQRDGALTGYLAVPWGKLYASERLALGELALAEPLAVGFHAVDRGRVRSGETVAVLGCGAIGLGAIAGAACREATVIAVDVADEKLATAKKFGATHAVNSQTEPLHGALEALTGGDGPDVIIEAVGRGETYRAAIAEVAFAGRVVYIGYAGQPVAFETSLFVKKELDILGSRNALGDFRAVIEMLESRRFPAGAAISRTVPLDQAGDALRAWDQDPAAFTRIHVLLDEDEAERDG